MLSKWDDSDILLAVTITFIAVMLTLMAMFGDVPKL
jgi:hypothetical protein